MPILPRPLIAALLVGALLRLLALAWHPPLDIDETRYLVTAHHLHHGAGYADWGGPEIDILPLHPWFTSLFGEEPGTLEWRGRGVACAASIISLFLLAWLAWRSLGRDAAIVGTWLVAIHPWLLRAAARPQSESLYVLCVVAGLLTLEPIIRGAADPLLGAIAGEFFGLAYLARPEGLLVGLAALACVAWSLRRTPRGAGLVAMTFAGALLVVAGPYFTWLHHVGGDWTLTGKTAKIFFIGQAMHDNAGQPPSAEAYLSLQSQYRSIVAFAVAHPLELAGRVGRFAVTLFAWILPRALGPLGLVGLAIAAMAVRRRREATPIAWWVLLPALVLPLMVFTYPNERVVGTAIPFLLIVAAAGLVRGWRQVTERRPHRRRLMLAATLVLVAVPWIPPTLRAAGRGSLAPDQPDREAAMRALAARPAPGPIVTNSPVVSFHVLDPTLFGPAGRYRPLEPNLDCASLAREMRRRESRIAVIEHPSTRLGPGTVAPDCPLALVDKVVERGPGRRFEVLRLEPPTPLR